MCSKSHIERWEQEWLTLGTKICHVLVLWFDLDGWILARAACSSLFLTTDLRIRFPLLCCTENWDPEEFVKNWRLVALVSFNTKERWGERQYELVREWLAGSCSPEPDIRLLGRSADTVLPRLFHPAHSYTDLITPATDLLSWGKIYCQRQNSQPISQSVEHCRAESGNGRRQTFFTKKRKEKNIWRVWTAAMCLPRR